MSKNGEAEMVMNVRVQCSIPLKLGGGHYASKVEHYSFQQFPYYAHRFYLYYSQNYAWFNAHGISDK